VVTFRILTVNEGGERRSQKRQQELGTATCLP
jgi:hypothetical protein